MIEPATEEKETGEQPGEVSVRHRILVAAAATVAIGVPIRIRGIRRRPSSVALIREDRARMETARATRRRTVVRTKPPRKTKKDETPNQA